MDRIEIELEALREKSGRARTNHVLHLLLTMATLGLNNHLRISAQRKIDKLLKSAKKDLQEVGNG